MTGVQIKRVSLIAPSTCLPRSEKSRVTQTIRYLTSILGQVEIDVCPYLFSSDELIDHVTAPLDDRAESFKEAIRNSDLIISVAGGTGAEDILFKIDKKDYRILRERKPLLVGFSDFTFLLNEIYYNSRIPAVYFPTLRLGRGNLKKIEDLFFDRPIQYHGTAWLTDPPKRRLSGIPLGGNLSTFVNFLNRKEPPAFNWKKYILFFEDIQIDAEDLHRLLAALRRHKVFKEIKGLVIGSLASYNKNGNYRAVQKENLRFIRNYLSDIIEKRKERKNPLPILSVSNFGHNVPRDMMAVPVGGQVVVDRHKNVIFRLHRQRKIRQS